MIASLYISSETFKKVPFVLGDKPQTDIPASIEEIEVKLENLMESAFTQTTIGSLCLMGN